MSSTTRKLVSSIFRKELRGGKFRVFFSTGSASWAFLLRRVGCHRSGAPEPVGRKLPASKRDWLPTGRNQDSNRVPYNAQDNTPLGVNFTAEFSKPRGACTTILAALAKFRHDLGHIAWRLLSPRCREIQRGSSSEGVRSCVEYLKTWKRKRSIDLMV